MTTEDIRHTEHQRLLTAIRPEAMVRRTKKEPPRRRRAQPKSAAKTGIPEKIAEEEAHGKGSA